ncbi:MAG: HAD hydrolase-like protein [Saprospirales bacterium]|nr:HAD hydrolase-like protein [Saprospirales bacterium]
MQHFIFDLDGTISNPEKGIVNGYKYAFGKLQIPIPSHQELVQLIGPPLRNVFRDMYGFSEEDTTHAIEVYREYYNHQGGLFENNLFDGIDDLFASLNDKNKTLHVATFKGAAVDIILKHFKIDQHFKHVLFYNEVSNMITKEKMIEYIMQQENANDKNKVVMIGDRKHDLLAAKNVGVKSVGVLYGFGSEAEINACEPDFIAKDIKDLHAILNAM